MPSVFCGLSQYISKWQRFIFCSRLDPLLFEQCKCYINVSILRISKKELYTIISRLELCSCQNRVFTHRKISLYHSKSLTYLTLINLYYYNVLEVGIKCSQYIALNLKISCNRLILVIVNEYMDVIFFVSIQTLVVKISSFVSFFCALEIRIRLYV